MTIVQPLVSFQVSSSSPDELRAAEELAKSKIDLNSVVIDVARHRRGGAERIVERTFRLGDCFSEIEIISTPAKADSAESFKIVFHVRDDADHYWKDIIVRILRSIRESGASVRPC